ncbi:aminoglycoside phosphotransferase family protein [Planococcus sp. CP5-4]|uniref:phosphotransferase n=1 Tax=unclassified Planococcus (in: firmicutes) TaxID=2662419 RepID=UPI001C214D4C|nr:MULTISPECIES: aminoglycoside phosphotransferase family protein [unclassified Planococcus (in: firmicutes)]MBU9672679.1 aminoglycoside phosphotransferase family protein [Planococcus sp. CP5-4_YE]MBV0908453.1 aminoglycoside phosphotransferase family protein [Planococcus sp. CP5-4_UN]MBW6063220.1 aminoglycoside phosphotransferase family protein [Planococcus sp. CP5-4]
MSAKKDGEKLSAGNVSDVYRFGNTVHRELKPESFRIHLLLNHLEKKGFQHAPQVVGVENGKEILTYMEGEAGNYPLKEYMWSDEALKEIAKMLRLYHDSVSDFSFNEDWKPLDHTPRPYEVICHNDFAVYNIIFNNEKPIGIIDFDNAAPGPRLWDIVYTLYTCIPLSIYHLASSNGKLVHDDSTQDERIKQRIKLFFEAYGEEVAENYLEMVVLRLEGLCKTIRRKAEAGDIAFQNMIKDGHLEHYEKDINFIQKNGYRWT